MAKLAETCRKVHLIPDKNRTVFVVTDGLPQYTWCIVTRGCLDKRFQEPWTLEAEADTPYPTMRYHIADDHPLRTWLLWPSPLTLITEVAMFFETSAEQSTATQRENPPRHISVYYYNLQRK